MVRVKFPTYEATFNVKTRSNAPLFPLYGPGGGYWGIILIGALWQHACSCISQWDHMMGGPNDSDALRSSLRDCLLFDLGFMRLGN